MTNSKKTRTHSIMNLPTIKFACGKVILPLPSSKMMGQAIEKHALGYKKKFALTQED